MAVDLAGAAGIGELNSLSFFYSLSMVVLINGLQWQMALSVFLLVNSAGSEDRRNSDSKFMTDFAENFIQNILYSRLFIFKVNETCQSFSLLRLIKGYLRSCLNEAKLSNLTLLCVEWDINTNKD